MRFLILAEYTFFTLKCVLWFGGKIPVLAEKLDFRFWWENEIFAFSREK